MVEKECALCHKRIPIKNIKDEKGRPTRENRYVHGGEWQTGEMICTKCLYGILVGNGCIPDEKPYEQWLKEWLTKNYPEFTDD